MPADVRRGDQNDLYELLEVSPNASPEVVQAAYRALVRTSHPDLNATAEAERRIRELNAAYQVLGDPERRARYDLKRARARRHVRLANSDRPVPRPESTVVVSPTASEPARSQRFTASRPIAARAMPEERFFAIGGQGVVMLGLLAALAILLAVVVWTALDSMMAEDDGPVIYRGPSANQVQNQGPRPLMVFDPSR